eukprot:2428853-Prymnesium_polylepis.1
MRETGLSSACPGHKEGRGNVVRVWGAATQSSATRGRGASPTRGAAPATIKQSSNQAIKQSSNQAIKRSITNSRSLTCHNPDGCEGGCQIAVRGGGGPAVRCGAVRYGAVRC